MYKKFLITGGAGFIGSHLVNAILEKDLGEVTVLDNFDTLLYEERLKRQNLVNASKSNKFHLIEGDIRNQELVNDVFETIKPNILVHFAALAGVRPSIKNPALYWDVNLVGTTTLFEAATKYKVSKIIFASSSSVYGNNSKIPFSESDAVNNPISPYAASKRAGELLCSTYNHLYGVPITALRFFTVYGPAQRPEMAIHKFTRQIDQNEEIELYGDGLSRRDYTYIDDIIAGVVGAIGRESKGFDIYNLGNSNTVSLLELVQMIESLLGERAKVKFLPNQPGDVDQTYADISKAKLDLGFEPKVTIKDGIERFVEWYRKQNKRP